MTVTVITGANSGIGRATALHLASRGHRVFGTMRSLDKGDKLAAMADELGVEITPIVLDVTDDAAVTAGFGEILSAAGTVDVLVNNAGIGSISTVEDVDIAAEKQVFDANVWGVVRCTQAVLPAMRAQGSGHIVQISSIAGRVGIPAQPMYCASKWALEGMTESLAHDVAAFGVRVSIVEPGVTRTGILGKSEAAPDPTAYDAVYGRMMDLYATGIVANARPELVAETIEQCLEADPGQLRWPVAWGAEQLVWARHGGGVTDAEWTELGALVDQPDAWRARFAELFDLPLIDATGGS